MKLYNILPQELRFVSRYTSSSNTSTHSLAMILTQPSTPGNDTYADTIERLKHCDVKLSINEDDNDVHVYYVGQKKPPLPEMPVPLLTDAFKTHQGISKARATELDFQFMKDMNASTDCPEYHGYNTKGCR